MIYLASKSPRRQELLKQIGIEFKLVNADIDETPLDNELALDYVNRIAVEKALFAASNYPDKPLLAADTTVVCKNAILGKPRDQAHYQEMMTCLSGNSHQVITAVAITQGSDRDTIATTVSTSEVNFRELMPSEIEAYWQTGEPIDKAGGYAIQGMAAAFISNIHGSYSGIMGLPLFETAELLKKFAIKVI
jgi:septum formation protein